MTEAEAIAYVRLHAQTDAFPSIETDAVGEIVRRNVRATVWTASTTYKVGARVQPTTPNGHFYECVDSGISIATEPNWTTRESFYVHDGYGDGAELIWRECAIDLDGNRYNLRNAIHECWTLKSAMAAKEFDVSIENQKWNRSQIYQHCLEMARAFSPID